MSKIGHIGQLHSLYQELWQKSAARVESRRNGFAFI
jgi:hypothetical protein